jgi:hypothetical protein
VKFIENVPYADFTATVYDRQAGMSRPAGLHKMTFCVIYLITVTPTDFGALIKT